MQVNAKRQAAQVGASQPDLQNDAQRPRGPLPAVNQPGSQVKAPGIAAPVRREPPFFTPPTVPPA